MRALALSLLLALTVPAMAQGLPKPGEVAKPLPPETLAFIDAAIAERRIQDAEKLIQRARALSDGPEIRLREAELMLARGNRPQATAAFALLENDPAFEARAKLGAGLAALAGGDQTGAEAALAAALALDPTLVRAWSARGVIADGRRDWAAAEAHYARALALDPAAATVYNNRGWSRLMQKRHAEAEADLVKALELEPGLAAARTNLNLARALQGRYDEAFVGSTKARLPADLNTAGFAALMRGDLALAESYFARAIELNGRFDATAAANLDYLKQLAAAEPR